MARSTTEKRRLIKFSNYSMCVTLPKWVIDQLEWKKGDQITLTTDVKVGRITLYKETEKQSLKPSSKQVSESSPKLRW